MFNQQKKHSVDVLFVIVLFCVFSLSVIALTGVGAKVYDNIVNKMTDNYRARTSFTYVINKVRQADKADAVDVGVYSGCEALILSEEIDNITYCTYLYFYDGYVKEFFTRKGQEFDPSYGTDIISVDSFVIEKETESLLKIKLSTDTQNNEVLYIHLHSRQEGNS